jgi:hypothetical protein
MKSKYYNILATGYAVATAWQTITARGATPAMHAAGVALTGVLHDIETHALQQAEPLTGKTRDRNAIFGRAADAAHAVARLILGHALERGLEELAGRVNLAPSAYRRGRMTHRLQLMRQVHAAAIDATAQGVVLGVTPEMLADFGAKIAAADAVLTLPRTNIVNRCVATENLRRSVQALKRLLQYTLDPLMDLQRATDPDGHALYKGARIVIDYSRDRTACAASANDGTTTPGSAPEPVALTMNPPASDSDGTAEPSLECDDEPVTDAGIVPLPCEARVARRTGGELDPSLQDREPADPGLVPADHCDRNGGEDAAGAGERYGEIDVPRDRGFVRS